MKTGIILYFAGEQTVSPASEVIRRSARKLVPEADRIEIISRDEGHWDIADAWWLLMAGGMNRILVKLADYSREEGLRLTGREMRLSG